MTIFLTLIFAALATDFQAAADPPKRESADQLLIFTKRGDAPVSGSFRREPLAKIKEIADAQGVSVREVDIAGGVPEEVLFTPAIVYQSHRGRSFFQGRFKAYDRFDSFLRVARRVPQDSKVLVREDIAVWKTEQVSIAAHIKISPVTGSPPDGYDEARFLQRMKDVVVSSFDRFRRQENVSLRRMDREFYLDFYPWCADDGTIYLSTALYSQFHCKKPVYSSPGDKITGPHDRSDALFKKATRLLESKLVDHLNDTLWGDGFEPISSDVPRKSWDALGLALPPRPQRATSASDAEKPPTLKTDWEFKKGVNNVSARKGYFLFHFPAPFDSYSGRVGEVWGTFSFDPAEGWHAATIQFTASPASVTMGDADLDRMIHEEWLDTESFPQSTFSARQIKPDEPNARLQFGEVTLVTMNGTFSMIGKETEVVVRAQLEPILRDGGNVGLAFRGGFELPLAPFDLEGPDEEHPASGKLEFTFDLLLD